MEGDRRRRADGSIAEARSSLQAAIEDRYSLESLVDTGGMGFVFSALDRKHGRRVAIKTFDPERSEGLAPRFEREIRITAKLQHPNILPLLDSGVADEILYYIMPFVEGESLKTRLDRVGHLKAEEAVRIALEVGSGLEHAHRRGVIHRDIKPSNVLLTEGQVQIVDFGIARAVVELDGSDLTGTGHGVGTRRYMAPEQLVGEATARSDIYALGTLLYEALTGRDWWSERQRKEPSWTRVPTDLGPIVTRGLEPSPQDRWEDVSDFVRALREWRRAQTARDAEHGSERPGWFERVRRRLRGEPATVDRKSVAVLPFENLNRDEETEYFTDGVTEDIIAHLSRIKDLKVISRTSVMRYKGTDAPVGRIGEELGVSSVLEGTVRRVGDRVRVVSQLIDTHADEHLWSETFDRSLTDIFEIQSDVAQRIAVALEAHISDAERSLIRRRPTADVEAHDLYLKGRHLWNRRTQAGLKSAEEQFKRAVARDPVFAPAYGGLADVYLLEAGYGYRDEIEGLHKARTAVDRALELDDGLAEAHASRGQILRADRDWAGEEREYRKAIELNPNYATAHQWYATLLTARGRIDEGLEEIDRATELDPLSHAIGVTSGIVRIMARDYEGAEAELERTRALEPRFFSTEAWLSLLWSVTGEVDRALEAVDRVRQLHPDVRLADFNRAFVLAVAGRKDEALAALEEWESRHPHQIGEGIVRAQIGEVDEAVRLLEEVLGDPSWRLFVLERSLLLYLKVGPWLDPLRDHPRFERLLELMNMKA